jgi:prepilin-type N-terminal cleavage/methylation domain-containing protein
MAVGMRRGFVLIEILIVVAIIALLAVGYYGLAGDGDETGTLNATSTPGQALERAKLVECASNLQTLRGEIELFQIDNDRFPQKFNPSPPLGACPVSGKPYQYDPQTGRIWCTTPGHEKL